MVKANIVLECGADGLEHIPHIYNRDLKFTLLLI